MLFLKVFNCDNILSKYLVDLDLVFATLRLFQRLKMTINLNGKSDDNFFLDGVNEGQSGRTMHDIPLELRVDDDENLMDQKKKNSITDKYHQVSAHTMEDSVIYPSLKHTSSKKENSKDPSLDGETFEFKKGAEPKENGENLRIGYQSSGSNMTIRHGHAKAARKSVDKSVLSVDFERKSEKRVTMFDIGELLKTKMKLEDSDVLGKEVFIYK